MACSKAEYTLIQPNNRHGQRAEAAPIKAFRNGLLKRLVSAFIKVGYLVEVWRYDIREYWIAVVQKIEGCWVRLRWFGSGLPESTFKRSALNHYCSSGFDPGIHPLGFCTTHQLTLCPPNNEVVEELHDLCREETSYTLDQNYDNRVAEFLASFESKKPFTPGMILETSNTDKEGFVMPARVEAVRAGFVKVRYLHDAGRTFTAHQASNQFHPVGWGLYHNMLISATGEYIDHAMRTGRMDPEIIPWWFASRSNIPSIKFPRSVYPDIYHEYDGDEDFLNPVVERGMILEVVDWAGRIRVGYIVDILPNYYLLINIYKGDDIEEFDTVAYHISSPYLLRRGFAEENYIDIDEIYPDADPVPASALDKRWRFSPGATMGFKVNHQVEVFNKQGEETVRNGVIEQIAEHLLLISFPGFPESDDRWIDFKDPHLLPVGFASGVGLKLHS